jgi:hypothetical protein
MGHWAKLVSNSSNLLLLYNGPLRLVTLSCKQSFFLESSVKLTFPDISSNAP